MARRGAVALALLAAATVLTFATAEPAHAIEGLRYEAHSTYTVDAAAGVVRVVVDATLTNEQPDSTSGNVVTSYYFPRFPVPMLSGATNVVATREGRSQGVEFESTDSGLFKIAFVDLSPDLYYRDVAHVIVTYDLPSEPPRSEATTRVNPAFATFWAWPVADPNLTSVRVLVPKRFEVDSIGPNLRRSDNGDAILYESGAIANPETWGVVISARDDDRLATIDAGTDDHDIEIRAWPDDPEWGAFVAGQIDDGLPVLEDLIDQPWPTDDELQITETVSPYLYGYAGWYSADDNTIEVGDRLDPEVILHEISHIWFNDELFTDRWISEGFAQTYSNLAVVETGGDAREPKRVVASARGAQPLNAWSNPTFRNDEESEAEEEFGYNASWFVIEGVTDEIGVDRMRDVIDAAADETITYTGDPEPERLGGATSWKRLLDLLENVGASERAARLWRDHVVADSARDDLTARSRARSAYDELVAAGDAWTVPYEIRADMARWQFRSARQAMATATSILELRDEIVATLDGTGVGLPHDFEVDFEAAKDLESLEATAEDYLAAAEQVAAAHREAEAGHGLLGTIGLWGDEYETELARADGAYERGDAAGATAAAAAVIAAVDGASGVGLRRALLVVGAFVALLALVLVLWWWRRRRRRRRAAAAESAAAAAAAAEPAAPPEDLIPHQW
jgi:hypothetical protein